VSSEAVVVAVGRVVVGEAVAAFVRVREGGIADEGVGVGRIVEGLRHSLSLRVGEGE